MDHRESNGVLGRTSLYPRELPLGFHVDRIGLPLKETYGVAFHFDSSYWDQVYLGCSGHFSYLPVSAHVGLYGSSFEHAFIRKRNERERQRVRFVNEGYTHLRQHLPLELAEKRLSKVETLRAAISYIKSLQSLLDSQSLGLSKKEKLLAKKKMLPSTFCVQTAGCSDCESKMSSPFSHPTINQRMSAAETETLKNHLCIFGEGKMDAFVPTSEC